MAVFLDHTIVHARDAMDSATFLTEMLGLDPPVRAGHFVAVPLANGVTLDFMTSEGPIVSQHYAFAVSDREFDAAFERIWDRGLTYWADPARSRPGRIREHDGRRGLYFEDPSGHFLEILTDADVLAQTSSSR
jgi:catechol 2,3-dioxygenase-like lactoylglutathione lyase family enzyme